MGIEPDEVCGLTILGKIHRGHSVISIARSVVESKRMVHHCDVLVKKAIVLTNNEPRILQGF